MLYGFPLSIADTDCDVDTLDPHDECSTSTSRSRTAAQVTLLHYKCAMLELYSIIKSSLVDLYGTYRDRRRRDEPIVDQTAKLSSLVSKVELLNTRLTAWSADLDPKLKLSNLENLSQCNNISDKDLNRNPRDPKTFEEHLFQLQALALRLAFENAKILIYRPLLSFRVVSSTDSQTIPHSTRLDPFSAAAQTCRDAALQISWAAVSSGVRKAADTYAVAFMSLHLFTAAVTLCIITNLDPLSQNSHECKLGIRRLMEAQNLLKGKSIVASQGLAITKRLMSLVIAKETDAIFSFSSSADTSGMRTDDIDDLTQIEDAEKDIPATTLQIPEREETLPPLNCNDNTNTDHTSIDFCANPSMTEAVLEFDQVFNHPTSKTTGPDQFSVLDQLGSIDDLFVGQDQAWMWDWEL